MAPGQECYQPVIDLFGKDVIKNDKTIDRKRVSDVVFEQPDFLSRLNGIIHPAVKRYILKSLEEQKNKGPKLCIVEAALFLEEHYQEFCDEVWYIHTDEEIRIQLHDEKPRLYKGKISWNYRKSGQRRLFSSPYRFRCRK